ncbi:hypothetical protein H4582DRAFT_2072923 [Lactarius indigo]|nr:hypothetical protein H4582DRAFT_2072923 [Lactarius indigo]
MTKLMTHKEAMIHEIAARYHLSNVEQSFTLCPPIFKYVGEGKWLCGCRNGAMTLKQAVAHEPWCRETVTDNLQDGKESIDKHLSSQEWADLSVGSWHEGPEAAEWESEAGSLHGLLDYAGEADGNITSVHQEGTVFEPNDGDNDNDNNDDSDNDDDDAIIIENVHDIDASRSRERMQSFYEMTTDHQIQKIQELIRDLRGQ